MFKTIYLSLKNLCLNHSYTHANYFNIFMLRPMFSLTNSAEGKSITKNHNDNYSMYL